MKLHNTLTGTVDDIVALQNHRIKLYTCGLTVYSQPHIGNWIGYIYWDILKRTLEAEGYTVEHAQNITDVGHLTSDDDDGEDKMEKGARIEGASAWDVAEKYIRIADHEAYDLLKLRRPTHLARATDYIDQQIVFASKLESLGLTYLIEGEGLYFDTSKLEDYGKLARLDIAGLQAGKRVAVNGKRLVTDFAIWKLSPIGSSRDMEWQSPWGIGFPGWHLECSVIALETLGEQIDIHTGGIDHIPVHHTNEIAQTEGIFRKTFSSIWVHNNHIKIDGTKISKSIGNIVTIDDIVSRGYDLNSFKLLALSKHYRTEGNFDWNILSAANNRLNRWRAVASLRHQIYDSVGISHEVSYSKIINSIKNRLSHDLDTPAALAILDDAFNRIEALSLERIDQHGLVQLLEAINDLLGVDIITSTTDISDKVKKLILERERARKNKDWARSDEIRKQLLTDGVSVRDTNAGTIWNYSTNQPVNTDI